MEKNRFLQNKNQSFSTISGDEGTRYWTISSSVLDAPRCRLTIVSLVSEPSWYLHQAWLLIGLRFPAIQGVFNRISLHGGSAPQTLVQTTQQNAFYTLSSISNTHQESNWTNCLISWIRFFYHFVCLTPSYSRITKKIYRRWPPLSPCKGLVNHNLVKIKQRLHRHTCQLVFLKQFYCGYLSHSVLTFHQRCCQNQNIPNVVRVRLELTTSCVSDRCYYNQLSYLTIFVAVTWIEQISSEPESDIMSLYTKRQCWAGKQNRTAIPSMASWCTNRCAIPARGLLLVCGNVLLRLLPPCRLSRDGVVSHLAG